MATEVRARTPRTALARSAAPWGQTLTSEPASQLLASGAGRATVPVRRTRRRPMTSASGQRYFPARRHLVLRPRPCGEHRTTSSDICPPRSGPKCAATYPESSSPDPSRSVLQGARPVTLMRLQSDCSVLVWDDRRDGIDTVVVGSRKWPDENTRPWANPA